MAKYRVMIIDDDEDARRMIGLALRDRFEIVFAYDGLDALSKLETHEPDLAIIDVMMPLMDGYQVCAAIRRNAHFQAMPVLFLSAYGTKEHIKRAYEVGANLFMTKPVDPDRILKNLDFTITHEPPPLRNKRHSVSQLEMLERQQQNEMQRQQEAQPQAPPQPPPQAPPPRPTTAFGVGASARPTPATPAQPAPAPKPANGPAGERPRIMLVDDDTDMLMMLEIALRDDYEVVSATNGMEAVERLVDFQPDLMLLDIMMPKMNGYQLLQSVRRTPPTSALPVIILSAKSSAKDQEYAGRLGATLFLAKPCPIDHLLRTLSGITHGRNFRLRPKKLTVDQIKAKLEAKRQQYEHPPEEAVAKPPRKGPDDEIREHWEG